MYKYSVKNISRLLLKRIYNSAVSFNKLKDVSSRNATCDYTPTATVSELEII